MSALVSICGGVFFALKWPPLPGPRANLCAQQMSPWGIDPIISSPHGRGNVLVHNPNAAIFMAVKNVSHACVLQMLFAFLTAGSRELGDLFGMQMEKVSGNGTVVSQKLNINSSHVDRHFC